jgi:hypothetical protein
VAIIARPTGLVFEEMTRLDASLEQRVALQVRRLPIVIPRHTHIAHEHIRKTPKR